MAVGLAVNGRPMADRYSGRREAAEHRHTTMYNWLAAITNVSADGASGNAPREPLGTEEEPAAMTPVAICARGCRVVRPSLKPIAAAAAAATKPIVFYLVATKDRRSATVVVLVANLKYSRCVRCLCAMGQRAFFIGRGGAYFVKVV